MVTSTNHINLVLEYVDSGSLANVLAGYGFFPEPLAALYIEQVLCGLSYLHKNNIIHRDIKGNNMYSIAQKEYQVGPVSRSVGMFGLTIRALLRSKSTYYEGRSDKTS